MKQLLIFIFCGFFWHQVYAEQSCGVLTATKRDGSVASRGEYIFSQNVFADGKLDLAIEQPQSNASAELRRVTFGRGGDTKCYFQPLAFVQGGQNEQYWGWHLLWAEPQGLFYARMDGEAWVSSNPKRLSKLAPIDVKFKLDGSNIFVIWQQVENGVTANMQALSSDEGRSWDISVASP
jgi:hypothetical protein